MLIFFWVSWESLLEKAHFTVSELLGAPSIGLWLVLPDKMVFFCLFLSNLLFDPISLAVKSKSVHSLISPLPSFYIPFELIDLIWLLFVLCKYLFSLLLLLYLTPELNSCYPPLFITLWVCYLAQATRAASALSS